MTRSELRTLFEQLGLRPSKALGQNFLCDANAARAIVSALDVAPGESVIEIGPGFGALTRHLLDAGACLLCIEKDRRLAEWLAQRFGQGWNGKAGRFELITGDACGADLRPLLMRGPSAVIGNLPYSVSSPLLLRWTSPILNAPRMVFTLQRELAERVCARPGTADYGPLTVAIQSRYEAKIERHLSPYLFHPEPSVESAVIRLRRHPPGVLLPHSGGRLRALVSAAFQARRKMVVKTLRPLFDGDPDKCERALREAGVAPSVRPEDIPVESWVRLACAGRGSLQAQDTRREMFDVVDESDRVIGRASRGEVHKCGLRHRAVHIFLLNRRGEIWLQRRSHLKDRHPGVWDSSASGHLDCGEDYREAALREVIEETGLSCPPPLEEIARIDACEETGWEFVRLYLGHHDGPFDPPPGEVECGEFFDINAVRKWLESRPRDFAPGFLKCFEESVQRLQND